MKKGHTHIQWITALLANTVMLTYGLQVGWVSPMSKVLQSEHSPTGKPITDNELSWIASAMCIASACSVLIHACLVDRFGRKACVIIIAVLQSITWILKLAARTTPILILSRVFCGTAVGGCFVILPIYIKEISQDNIRGMLGSLPMSGINVGTLLIYALGAYLDYFTVLWIVFWFPIATAIFMLKAPESPSYLVKVGKIDEAAKNIAFLRGLDKDDKEVQDEISSLKNTAEYFRKLPNLSVITILKNKTWRRGFFLVLSMLTVQAASGNFVIVTYAAIILAKFKVTIDPQVQALSIPVVMILGSLGSITCVDRWGRKPLLVTTLSITVVCMLTIGTTLLLHDQGYNLSGWIAVTAILVSVFMYSLGASSIPYIVMAEIFNFQVRSKLSGYAVTYAWVVSFSVMSTFDSMSKALTLCSPFYLYAGINLFGAIIGLTVLPETKGRSVEQIEELLNTK